MNWGIEMTDHEKDDQMLDEMFATARKDSANVSADLMARVMQNAQAVQAGFERETPKLIESRFQGFSLRGLVGSLGGWPAIGGLVAATAVGVWLGVAPLSGLSEVAGNYLFDGSTIEEPLGGIEADYAWLDTLGDGR